MKNVWYSRLSQVKLFLATEESVLMYGSEACTMTEKLTKAIDDVASGWFSWPHHTPGVISVESNKVGKDQESIQSSTTPDKGYHMWKWNLPKLSTKFQQRRMLFPGHNYRNSELVQVASQLVLWQPAHGRKNRRRHRKTNFDILLKDTRLKTVDEIATWMGSRDMWKAMLTRGCQRYMYTDRLFDSGGTLYQNRGNNWRVCLYVYQDPSL